MQWSPLDAPFGAMIQLELDTALSVEDGGELRHLLAEHGLLVSRGTKISRELQIDLVSRLGRVELDASGQPLEMQVTNQHENSTAPDGELVFHYDYAYDPVPIPAISMYGLLIEAGATPTLFANSQTIRGRIPESLIKRLEGHVAAHACFLYSPAHPHERTTEPEFTIARGESGWNPDHYWARHPLIWQNAAGVPTLFACLQHTDHIVGMSRRESDELLEEVFAHLYDRANVYEHEWQPDDLVIWDNLTVQHARPEPNAVPRTLRRFHVSETDLTEDYLRVGREHGFL